jgi:hypothetical protein
VDDLRRSRLPLNELVEAGRMRGFFKWVSPKSTSASKKKQRNSTTGVAVEHKSGMRYIGS